MVRGIEDIKQQSVEHRNWSARDYLLHFIPFALLKETACMKNKKRAYNIINPRVFVDISFESPGCNSGMHEE